MMNDLVVMGLILDLMLLARPWNTWFQIDCFLSEFVHLFHFIVENVSTNWPPTPICHYYLKLISNLYIAHIIYKNNFIYMCRLGATQNDTMIKYRKKCMHIVLIYLIYLV